MDKITQITDGRAELLLALDRYASKYPGEMVVIVQFREFVAREPGCFERTTKAGHITGSSWLVDASGQNTLLTHHRKLNKWLQLGGHADGDSVIVRVARTEAQEESGIEEIVVLDPEIFDLDIHPIPARGSDPEHLHYDVRFTMRAAHSNHVVSDESHDLAWVSVELIDDFTTEESMLRMARKWNILREESRLRRR